MLERRGLKPIALVERNTGTSAGGLKENW